MKYPELVFKTTSPEAIAWWKNIEDLDRQQREAREAFEAEMTELFGPSLRDTYERNEDGTPKPQTQRRLWLRGDYAYALDSGYNEQPPTDSGWRLDSKDRNWQPKLATKAGKEWKRRLGELNLTHIRSRMQEIGVPEIVFAGSYLYKPGLRFDAVNEILYNGWGTQHVEDELRKNHEKVPGITWERVKLSEYIAWLESLEGQE